MRVTGRHGQRISGERACLVHRAKRCDQVHDLRGTTIGAHWQAAADNLSHRGQVGLDGIEFLRAAKGEAETRHDLVEDQKRAVVRSDRSHRFQIAARGGNASHVADHRLDDHAGNLLFEFLKGLFERVGVVVGQRQGELGEFFGNSSGPRNAERGHTGTSFHEQGVGVSVIAALELHDVLALGAGAGQSNCGHGRFRPGTDEADFLHMRERREHEFGEVGFRRRGRSEAGAVAQGCAQGLDDHGCGVAENQRSPGADVVDVLVAIGVEDVGGLAAHHKRRISAHRAKGTHRGVDAARNHHFGAFLQFARLFDLAGHATS